MDAPAKLDAGEQESWSREDSDFYSRGLRLGAWLYRPAAAAKAPLIVMAHGFAAERSFRLPAFAERFARAGMAVLVFDYRCFGDSEGHPRNWVSPKRHLQDWEAALAHGRALEGVDASRIALWGTSFSGGHVVVMASRHPELSAVVAQVPFVDGRATLAEVSVGRALTLAAAGFDDLLRHVTRRRPRTIPVIGKPDSPALMNAPGCWEGYRAIVAKDSTWENACPARILLSAPSYRPTKVARRVKCPVLLVAAGQDQLIPLEAVEKEASRIPRCRLITFDCDHFAPYLGEWFERTVAAETEFLTEQLGLSR